MAEISSFTYRNIILDIERGYFAEFNECVARDYFDEDMQREILVTTRNDDYQLKELSVEIIDSLGDEHELPDELWAFMRMKAENALKDAERDDILEGEHVKDLWRFCYAQ